MTQLQKYTSDPIALALIEKKQFDVVKFEQVHSKDWITEITRIRPASVAVAIHSGAPTVATYRKYKGDFEVAGILSKMIGELALNFNIGKKMTSGQIATTVHTIMQRYYFLNLADLKLCFMNAIAGDYGELYDRLDANMILKWIKLYNDDRLDISAVLAANKHKEAVKEIVKPEEVDREMMAKIGELGRKLEERKRKIKPIETSPEEIEQRKAIYTSEAVNKILIERWDNDMDLAAKDKHASLITKYGTFTAMATKVKFEILNRIGKGESLEEAVKNVLEL